MRKRKKTTPKVAKESPNEEIAPLTTPKQEEDHTKSGQREPQRRKCALDHTKTNIRSQRKRCDLAKTTSANRTMPDAKKGPTQIRAAVKISPTRIPQSFLW
jgi:hypothetical protein